jgi:catechol-2,3-dioxygenase
MCWHRVNARPRRRPAAVSIRQTDKTHGHHDPDLRHYAFAAASAHALEAWRKRLRAAKVKITEEDHGDQQSLYFTDPNGVVLEITAPPSEKALERDPQAHAEVARWLKAHSA